MKVASFLENITFNESKPAISMVLETDFSKEIRIVFKKGQIMKDHKAPLPIVVQVLKGCIDFGVKEEVKQLNAGDLIYLKENSVHNLIAKEESIVRLTLSKLDTVKNVDKV
ncbi:MULTISPECIES: cupin domain-containing protein [unclassified Polaribacter]|uniref:cupin domain-containing protein n=1 Tax=unclassified Polaribacter TaxID=196858 RepID=UPI0011BF95AA|nr:MULTISPECIES: cupin domain-containing protein [unclassified Polaribacter]TXD51149.1 cupin domain-containing protein [Polaribacter sp. IC063]TXD56555.1 cupin domain-containing protein [Polaribacter sp. IC066]